MSFREKIAWVSLFAISAIYGWYLLTAWPFGAAIPAGSGALFWLVILLVVAQTIPIAVLAAFSPRDAQAPQDEREKLIALKSNRAGYAVLMAGTLAACAACLYFGIGGAAAANAVLVAVVTGELAKQFSKILYYRVGV